MKEMQRRICSYCIGEMHSVAVARLFWACVVLSFVAASASARLAQFKYQRLKIGGGAWVPFKQVAPLR